MTEKNNIEEEIQNQNLVLDTRWYDPIQKRVRSFLNLNPQEARH